MRTAAILPVKRFSRAKQRLSPNVADALRLRLAEAMVADVLLALSETDMIERTFIVTGEHAVAQIAHEHDAELVDDEHAQGQSAAANIGVRHALAAGMQRVLCVPGDCPTLDPVELDELLRTDVYAPDLARVVIVPDRHGTGTNGLLLAPADAIKPSFGPGSCERHHALALDTGVSCEVRALPSLLLDIDTSADLDVLRERIATHPTRAVHTREALEQHERERVLSAPSPG